jgi:hypothetical protein
MSTNPRPSPSPSGCAVQAQGAVLGQFSRNQRRAGKAGHVMMAKYRKAAEASAVQSGYDQGNDPRPEGGRPLKMLILLLTFGYVARVCGMRPQTCQPCRRQ